ncbi:hypothetical protein CK203_064584 [Vitis vinifera]|uniref:Uncharacterized protein n=1 Tax=Vitis vinifera TaxID=29760 RepID=A0A438G771_VITVI|nr:hypothetical protein CK203_064584 [Vitis vinifera]
MPRLPHDTLESVLRCIHSIHSVCYRGDNESGKIVELRTHRFDRAVPRAVTDYISGILTNFLSSIFSGIFANCRARPFHSELCFDIEAFQVRPELAQSFQLLRRYHMEHLLTPRDFFYPRIAMDFYQSMTTNQPCKFPMSQPNSIILELGQILLSWRWCAPFPEELPIDHISLDSKKGSPLRSSLQDVRRIFFGSHHLILAALLYFEEKVHKKKLQRADCIPLLFPRLLCQILEHLGYPSEPQLERKRICREPFTLDKWNNMTTYKVDQPEQPQPAARRAPHDIYLRSMPRADIGHSGSTSCHLKAAPSSFSICHQAIEPSTSTPAVPHSHPSESHPPEPLAPADAPTEEADPSA